MSSQHKLVSTVDVNCVNFHCHSSYSSDVMDRVFMTLLQLIKYSTTDNPNNIGLTFNPKTQIPQVERKRIFNISLKTHKT